MLSGDQLSNVDRSERDEAASTDRKIVSILRYSPDYMGSGDWSAIMEQDDLSRIHMDSRMSLLDRSLAHSLQHSNCYSALQNGRESVINPSVIPGRDVKSAFSINWNIPKIRSQRNSFSCPNMTLFHL